MKAHEPPKTGWGVTRRGPVEELALEFGGLRLGGRARSNLDKVDTGKPSVLFDINGSLLHRKSVPGSAGVLTMRPGLKALARLTEHFNLGLYTSAAPRTVTSILPQLDDHIGQGPIFRSSKLDQVVLVDGDVFKAVPGEESNLIYMPAWKKGDMDDDLLPRLVNLLLRYRVRMTDGDVRDFTAEITEALVASRDDPAIPDRAAPAAINSK
ncbi:hypothetical protein WJX75_005244 [Coccomyxa subellipsoidea]|uniref:FCP1 homology domain-containing protein n=1 Tax=Coccomyxa subellipsoidea TaxID=248742 RepID=A0ABR2YI05_9CHLO